METKISVDPAGASRCSNCSAMGDMGWHAWGGSAIAQAIARGQRWAAASCVASVVLCTNLASEKRCGDLLLFNIIHSHGSFFLDNELAKVRPRGSEFTGGKIISWFLRFTVSESRIFHLGSPTFCQFCGEVSIFCMALYCAIRLQNQNSSAFSVDLFMPLPAVLCRAPSIQQEFSLWNFDCTIASALLLPIFHSLRTLFSNACLSTLLSFFQVALSTVFGNPFLRTLLPVLFFELISNLTLAYFSILLPKVSWNSTLFGLQHRHDSTTREIIKNPAM